MSYKYVKSMRLCFFFLCLTVFSLSVFAQTKKDVTSQYIKNADCSSLDGWDYWGHDIPEYLDGSWATWHIYNSGDYSSFDKPFIERWVYRGTILEDGALSQTITGLTNGKYRVEADIIACQQQGGTGNETGTFLFASSGSDRVAINTCTQNGVPQHFAAEVDVLNGTLKIGFETINSQMNWIAIDNWKLYYMGEPSPPCSIPVITYTNGEISFSCETEDVQFVSEILSDDVKKYDEDNIQLSFAYNISVYASKNGYRNSDVATATLCWIEQEHGPETTIEDYSQIPSMKMLIQHFNGQLNIQGLPDGTIVRVYDINATFLGTTVSYDGMAIVNIKTGIGEVVILKVGNNSIKVALK